MGSAGAGAPWVLRRRAGRRRDSVDAISAAAVVVIVFVVMTPLGLDQIRLSSTSKSRVRSHFVPLTVQRTDKSKLQHPRRAGAARVDLCGASQCDVKDSISTPGRTGVGPSGAIAIAAIVSSCAASRVSALLTIWRVELRGPKT